MIANLTTFGYLDQQSANAELKRNLTEIKRAAELLLNLLDLTMGRMEFEAGEIDKVVALRQAILDFRSLEVNPGTPTQIMIDDDNMESLKELYGANTDACRNTIINDMIKDACIRAKKKNQEVAEGKLQKQLAKMNKSIAN